MRSRVDKRLYMYEIVISKSVGPFKLGCNISAYLPEYQLEYTPKESELEDWDSYRYKEGMISLYTNRGIIESIACRTDCYVDDFFLVGADLNSFFLQFDIDKENIEEDEIFLDDENSQFVYEIDSLGLQIWVTHDCKIETVFVS